VAGTNNGASGVAGGSASRTLLVQSHGDVCGVAVSTVNDVWNDSADLVVPVGDAATNVDLDTSPD